MASKNTVSGTLVDDKGTWTVRGRVTNPITGKVRNKSKSTGYKVKDNTKRKAAQAMAEILAQWEKEANRVLPNHDTTLRYYVEGWLHNMEVTGRRNTVATYWSYAQIHILPALGDIPVQDLTWRVLQSYYEGLFKTHKVASVKKYNVVVNGALEDARRDGVIPSNPVDLLKWPREERFEGYPYNKDEVKKILVMARAIEEPMRAAIILGLCYGLRRSEVCGLRWCDIDLEQGTMHIQHTVTQNGNVLLDMDSTKTKRSNRVLVLIPSTAAYFRGLYAQQKAAGLPMDKVVARPDGKFLRPDGVYNRFKTLIKKNGIDTAIRFHDLRHFAGSMLADHGVPLKQIQAFLGHDYNSPITSKVYIHEELQSGAKTSAAMDEILGDFLTA